VDTPARDCCVRPSDLVCNESEINVTTIRTTAMVASAAEGQLPARSLHDRFWPVLARMRKRSPAFLHSDLCALGDYESVVDFAERPKD
jgi:hypothetical protein